MTKEEGLNSMTNDQLSIYVLGALHLIGGILMAWIGVKRNGKSN